MEDRIYDVIIIGGGPAGCTAAIYAARAGLDAVLIEQLSAGGQMLLTEKIENYPGFSEGIDGFTLGAKMLESALRFGAETLQAEVLGADLLAEPKRIRTSSKDLYARTVIIAAGAKHKHLGLSHEDELIGKGVGYCAACDGMFYKDKVTAVVGGGNTAAADALTLSRICRRVYLIHRREILRAEKIYRDQLERAENIEFRWNSEVTELLYDTKLRGAVISGRDGMTEELELDGLFISIGMAPLSGIFCSQLVLDAAGFIVANESTRTSIPGVFAAGDIRSKSVRQIITAAADGASAVHYAQEYLTEKMG